MSYTKDNNNDKEEYTYTYIRIRGLNNSSNSKRRRTKLTLYVPSEFAGVIDKLEEIVKREGKSISRLFLDWAERYVRLHSPGNPQQTLDTIIKQGKPYRAPKQCIICGRPATRKALTYNEEWVPLCKFCLAKNKHYIRSHVPIEKQTGEKP
ncbi:hypothetical protein DRH14_04640 [Candidatus Shapirobacteria bacterium]|nr:MAG: hypothetical protein DRH14_04640 [Candidatus Shapirobacteria bacterium]